MITSEGLKRAVEIAAVGRTDYAQLKAEAEARVVRWEWADFSRESYEPAFFEINKFPRGKVRLVNENDTIVPPCQTGYDAQSRMIVEREYTEFPGHIGETFYVHEPDGIAEFRYDSYTPEKGFLGATWFSIREGKVVATDCAPENGNRISTTYDYNDRGQMIRQTRRGFNPPSTSIDDWHELEYDTKGRIVRIHWCFPDGRRILHFERPTRKTSLKTCRKQLLEGLTAAIIEAIHLADIKDEVYVLVVRYYGACIDQMLPPLIGLNTISERERLMREHPDYGVEASWNPCEWNQDLAELNYTLSPELSALCATVNQDIWQNERKEETLRFFFQLLRALYDADLPIRRIDDFVGVVLVMGESELTGQVSQQLPARARKSLQKTGWLPM